MDDDAAFREDTIESDTNAADEDKAVMLEYAFEMF